MHIDYLKDFTVWKPLFGAFVFYFTFVSTSGGVQAHKCTPRSVWIKQTVLIDCGSRFNKLA
ncbi:hypothetical protein BD289DRAFT_441540 [Coniella lustricola]|uniref:Uncharacterized protein n=1 Tax=Coniella lustricola TaxID=2025994 RepID=A0A2T2ZZ88_9PEZI|nr:hypothetical protein BD289DRAFT_441540 [Coniella lustricola]